MPSCLPARSVQAGHNRHAPDTPASPSWIPAFAGMTVGARNDEWARNDDVGGPTYQGGAQKRLVSVFRPRPLTALMQAPLLGLLAMMLSDR